MHGQKQFLLLIPLTDLTTLSLLLVTLSTKIHHKLDDDHLFFRFDDGAEA